MIMLSSPEYRGLHIANDTASHQRASTKADKPLPWPANEVMLSTLQRTGWTSEEIAALFGVDVASVSARVSEIGGLSRAG